MTDDSVLTDKELAGLALEAPLGHRSFRLPREARGLHRLSFVADYVMVGWVEATPGTLLNTCLRLQGERDASRGENVEHSNDAQLTLDAIDILLMDVIPADHARRFEALADRIRARLGAAHDRQDLARREDPAA